jgi:hypothetical protein
MKSSLAPRFSEIAIPVLGGQRYLDRQAEIMEAMKKEKRYEERGMYGAKALAITGVLWIYNVALAEAALFGICSGLAKLIKK